MPEVGPVRATFEAEVRQLLGALQQTRAAVQQTADTATSSMGRATAASDMFERSLGRTVSTARKIATALGAAGAGVIGLYRAATDAAGEVEQMNISLEILARNAGMSEEGVKNLASTIADQGIEMAVAQGAVQKFVQANLDLSKAQQLATAAQNVAAASGRDSTGTYYQMIHAIEQGNSSLEILRFLGIQVGEGQRELARDIDNATSRMSIQERQTYTLNRILAESAKFAGSYAEAQERSFRKFTGSFSRYINEILVALGTPFLKLRKSQEEVLGESLQLIRDVAERFQKLGFEVGEAFRPLAERIRDLREAVKAGRLDEFLERVSSAMKRVIEATRTLGPLLAAAFSVASIQGLITMAQLLPGVGGHIAQMASRFSGLGIVLVGLIASSEEGRQALAQFGAEMAAIATEIAPALTEAFRAVAAPLAELAGALARGGAEVFQAMVPVAIAFAQALTLVAKVAEPLVAVFNAIPAPLFTIVAAAVLVQKGMGLLSRLVQGAADAFLAVTLRIEEATNKTQQQIPAVTGLARAYDNLRQSATMAAGAVKAAATARAAQPATGPMALPGQAVGQTGKALQALLSPQMVQQASRFTRVLGGIASGARAAGGAIVRYLGGGANIAIAALIAGALALKGAFDSANAAADSLVSSLEAISDPKKRLEELKVTLELIRTELEAQEARWGFLASLSPQVHKLRRAEDLVTEAIKKAEKALADFNDESGDLDFAQKQVDDLREKVEALKKELEEAKALQERRRSTAFDFMGEVLTKTAEEATRLAQKRVEEEQRAATEVNRSLGSTVAAYEQANRRQEEFLALLSRQGASQALASGAVEEYAENLVRTQLALRGNAVTEEELRQLRREAYQEAAQLVADYQRSLRDLERSMFLTIASFRRFRDEVRGLDDELQRGAGIDIRTKQVLTAADAYEYMRNQARLAREELLGDNKNPLEELVRNTAENAQIQRDFVNNVNALAAAGHTALASSLAAMGVEGAEAARLAVEKMRSGEGLGEMEAAMADAAQVAKMRFDEEALRWGPNFADMASKATEQLAPVLSQGTVEAMQEAIRNVEPTFAEWEAAFNTSFAKVEQRWRDIATVFATDPALATALAQAGDTLAPLAGQLADRLLGGEGLGKFTDLAPAAMEHATDEIHDKMETFVEDMFSKDVKRIEGEIDRMQKSLDTAVGAIDQAVKDLAEATGDSTDDTRDAFLEHKSWFDKYIDWAERWAGDFLDIVNNTFDENKPVWQRALGLLNIVANPVVGVPTVVGAVTAGHSGGLVTAAGIRKMHGGGGVGGLGVGEVPAILQTGEFVMSRRAVERIGMSTLAALNRMHTGGPVSNAPSNMPQSQNVYVTQNLSVTVNVSGSAVALDDLAKDVRGELSRIARANAGPGLAAIGQQMALGGG